MTIPAILPPSMAGTPGNSGIREAVGATDPGRAPALWILVPAGAGILAAKACPLAHPVIACIAALTLAVTALYFATDGSRFGNSGRRGRVPRWALAVFGGAFLLFWSYGSARMLDRLEWKAALPPREVTMEMRVVATYKTDKFGNQRGLARIVDAPPIQHYLTGQEVIYRMKGDLAAEEGTTLRVKGLIQRLPTAPEPGSFEAWLDRNETYFELNRAHILAKTAPPSRFTRWMQVTRGWMRERLLEGSDELPFIRAMGPAMLLGEKNLLSPDDKALFKETGMMHLFAVSGLHVGLVALALEGILAALRFPRNARILAALGVLGGYVCVIGAPPSAVRAFLMILFHRAATLGGRPSRGLPALSASAIAVLVWDPMQLFDVGAQLSYGIVAGIMLYGMPLANILREKYPLYDDLPAANWTVRQRGMLSARDWLLEGFATTLGAFLVSVPLSAEYFGNFAPGSMLLNILMIPLALLSALASVFTILISGVALIPLFGWMGAVGIFFNHAGWLASWEMQGVIAAVDEVPFLFFKIHGPVTRLGGVATVAILAVMAVGHRKNKGAHTRLWIFAPVALLATFLAACVFIN